MIEEGKVGVHVYNAIDIWEPEDIIKLLDKAEASGTTFGYQVLLILQKAYRKRYGKLMTPNPSEDVQ